jgi:enoyl-CoA hydratase/carnithine racemase
VGPHRRPVDAPVLDRMPPLVRVVKKGGCAWVTLDRAPLNLIVPELIAELRATFEALAGDPGVRAAVVTGAGRAFTAGMQVQVLRDLTPATARALITSLHEAIHAVHDAPFPTVAMVNGPCLGAGFELAMACDLRVAAARAQLGLPEVKVGAPSVIEAALLPALVGPGRAAEMLLTGDSVTAERAFDWGLVNRVAPSEDLEPVTAALVERILACAPSAIRLQKELIVRWRNTDLASAVQAGIDAFARNYATGEGREAALAFLEKRPAKFE